jgi:hypothetical protein
MLALEESAPRFPVSRERDACHIPIRMTADDVRRLTGKGKKMSSFRDTKLSKERTVAGGYFEDAPFTARAKA